MPTKSARALQADDIARARLVPIERLVAHLKLRRVGRELVGPCPRCGGADRFAVYLGKQIFHCRGCRATGGVIDLCMFLHGCGFAEAVGILAGTPFAGGSLSVPPAKTNDDRRALARRLWAQGTRAIDSPVEDYLAARGIRLPRLPRTLRYLPANTKHPHALIAAFGLAHEVEPGIIDIADDAVLGVHVTRLLPDGSDRERGDKAKITIGTGFVAPIILAPANDLLGMAVTEGIEDGLTVHAATGLGVWAAGSAGRMPALADLVPSYVEAVTIYSHGDDAGQKGARGLADRLVARGGLDVFVEGLS
jgi:hypothetical protein